MLTARLFGKENISVEFESEPPHLRLQDFFIQPFVKISKLQKNGKTCLLHTAPMRIDRAFFLSYKDTVVEILPDKILDDYRSQKALGCSWDSTRTLFRVFSPRASKITLFLFSSPFSAAERSYDLKKDDDGVWELQLPGHYFGKYYAYGVDGPQSRTEIFDKTKLIADPYSRAVVTDNSYHHRGRSLIIDPGKYDWEGDSGVQIPYDNLIIYECHIRDMTADSSSRVNRKIAGTYSGFCDRNSRSGIEYIKSLGVNAVEFLPLQEYGNIEIPYGKKINHLINTWNPYSRNHWGYMTSYFFAPESYYATEQHLDSGHCGADGRQIFEFKDVVKALHRHGIAVILDVVFNHVSHYDRNCFKLLDKKYYFRLDDGGDYLKTSGCGNDFKTERPMARKMILDCLKYWIEEYHIDGFRFDLAALIDPETVEQIGREISAINPDVILIAEPWGGDNYKPSDFSGVGWAAWNDQYRNGIKGENPEHGQSFIFGRWWGHNNKETLKRYISGTLKDQGGLFNKAGHSINYLASHDDYALGDFIRIGSGEFDTHERVTDLTSHVKLSTTQLRINKLAALVLLTSRGACMLTAGQEYAHSKVIAKTLSPDHSVGKIDNNSYNKDNATNWVNYDHADLNKSLLEYYRHLIHLRKSYPVITDASATIRFIDHENPFAIGYAFQSKKSVKQIDLLVLLNGDAHQDIRFELPAGKWKILINDSEVHSKTFVESEINLSPTSAVILAP